MPASRTLLFCFIACGLQGCITPFNAYLRNPTEETALVDVYLLSKEDMPTLPNKVKVANRLVDFKSGYQKQFNSNQNVDWVDTSHFQFKLPPNSTADLEDMVGAFYNRNPRGNVRVTVTTMNKTDTLLNGVHDFRYQLFGYKKKFFTPILFYDVKQKDNR